MNNFSIPENMEKEGKIVTMRTIFLWEAFIDSKGNFRFIRQLFNKSEMMKLKERENEKKEIKTKDKIMVTESDEVIF